MGPGSSPSLAQNPTYYLRQTMDGARETEEGPRVLRRTPRRTVRKVHAQGGSSCLEKVFHSAQRAGLTRRGARLASLGDRWRAAREARAMVRAKRAGLPVPELLGIQRGPHRSWILRQRWVEGSKTLEAALLELYPDSGAALAGVDPAPFHAARALAGHLSALCQKIDRAGFVHGDPHPSNLVLDADGRPWIVDLARSRTGRGQRAVRAQLLQALAKLRDLAPRTFRWRVARAWLGPREARELARSFEGRAEVLRVAEMERRVEVWRRESSATESRATRAQGVNGERTFIHVRELPREPARGWQILRVVGGREEVDAIWETLVLARLHRLPGCQPRAISLDPDQCGSYEVLFDVPEGAHADQAHVGRAAMERATSRLRRRGLAALPRATEESAHRPLFVPAPDGSALVSHHARLVPLSLRPGTAAR